MTEEKQKLVNLFEQIITRENEIKELREEIKDSISIFCDENEQYEPKVIKDGFRFFKKLIDDHQEATTQEYMRDKIVEIFLPRDTE